MAQAYGQITIVDIGDLGQLSVYPSSNNPYSVIYNPDATPPEGATTEQIQSESYKYIPDWRTTPLELTPIIYYSDERISATNVTVTWSKMIGNAPPQVINNNNTEVITEGILKVKDNVLSSSNNLITYICNVTYTEPNSQAKLVAEGRITFSFIEQPSKVKSIKISGPSVFALNSDGNIKGSGQISLTALTKNVSINKWVYRSGSNWVDIDFTDSNNHNIITLDYTKLSFDEDGRCLIRVISDDTAIYDEHTIVKVRDGAAGNSTIAVVLSNEDQMIPFKNENEAVTDAYANAFTNITIWDGNNIISDPGQVKITAVPTDGIPNTEGNRGFSLTKSPTEDHWKCTVTKITKTSQINITVKYKGKTINKTFSLVKVVAGADGKNAVVYSLEVSNPIIVKDITEGPEKPTFLTKDISLKAWRKEGNNSKEPYPARFGVIYSNVTTIINSSDNSSITYNFPADKLTANLEKVRFVLLPSGGDSKSTPLDSQTVTVISNGAKGPEGQDALTMVLGNYSDQIPCNSEGETLQEQLLLIPYYVYKGATKLDNTKIQVAVSNIPSDISLTESNNGFVKLQIPAGKTLGKKDSINITISLTAEGQTSDQNFKITKSLQGIAGKNAVIFQVYAMNGGIFVNGQGTDTLKTLLTDGGVEKTADISYQWAKWNGSEYALITDTLGNPVTTSTLKINASDISSFASYQVAATYGREKPYYAYISILDKSDPLQAYVFSTLGDKITNNIGEGCVYSRIYQNGKEIDELQNLSVSKNEPASATLGDIWVEYNASNRALIYHKYNGKSWAVLPEVPKFKATYKWHFTNTEGFPLESNDTTGILLSQSNNKFLYVDGKMIDKKITFNLEVKYS